ncbi:MAG: hypothetical protein IIZ41_11650, partial [Lachnospiraceae bacterium]|nr:hypothetical protein [Lachnospiraceae bacterium]
IMIPVLIKSALQIISAIRLFIQAKKLPKKNKKQEQAQQRNQYVNPNGVPQYIIPNNNQPGNK